MKKLLLILPLAMLAVAAQAQEILLLDQVPAAVRATFKAKFPTVKTNTWEKEGGKYEAGFRLNGTTMSVLITPTGELTETETDMVPGKLPAAVRTALARDYRAYKVTETAMLVSAAGVTTYEAEVSKAGKSYDVLFNADGSLAKK